VAKVGPGQFISQVKVEAAKIVWPTRKQTVATALMVVVMTTVLGVFFFGVDAAFHAIVKALLSLIG
jgi:preprotein translocase subunit SecE